MACIRTRHIENAFQHTGRFGPARCRENRFSRMHSGFEFVRNLGTEEGKMASVRWLLQLHKDVPKAARFYSEGLDFSINVCTLRWAELQSGSLKLALMQSNRFFFLRKSTSFLSFYLSCGKIFCFCFIKFLPILGSS